MISRTQAKLETGQQEIKQKYRVQVQTLAVDFGKLDTAALTAIHDAVRRVDVGLLVNNVGISYDHAEYLDAIDDQLIDDLVQINVVAATKVRHRCLIWTNIHLKKQSVHCVAAYRTNSEENGLSTGTCCPLSDRISVPVALI